MFCVYQKEFMQLIITERNLFLLKHDRILCFVIINKIKDLGKKMFGQNDQKQKSVLITT